MICVGLIANGVFAQQEQISTSLYTGTMGLNVPIYTIQDPDFTLPISMTYVANGFMPEQEYGVVGMNWNLNAGGVITRKVYGFPDDHKLNNAQNPLNGRINRLIKGETFYDKDQTSLIMADNRYLFNPFIYSPDIFYFSLNGVNGWFYIDFQGEMVVVCDDPVTVDFSQFSGNISNTEDVPIIKLIDQNGYTYIYGSNNTSYYSKILSTKLTENSTSVNVNYKDTISYIDSWYLSKIIAPNGREMIFEYELITKSTLGVVLNEEVGNQTRYLEVDDLTNLWQRQDYRPSSSKYKLPILNKIRITGINDFEIKFNYSHEDVVLNILSYMKCPNDTVIRVPIAGGGYRDEPMHWECGCDWERDGLSTKPPKNKIDREDKINPGEEAWCDALDPILSREYFLTNIEIKQGENPTKRVFFSYAKNMCNRMGSANKESKIMKYPYKEKRYLTKIDIFQEAEYNFEYNFEYVTEASRKRNYQPMSQLLDIYGYSVYNPQYGMLKSVKNPFGGKTVFSYEPHRYSKVKMCDYNSDNPSGILLLQATTQSLYKNLRIKEIKIFDEDNNLVVRKNYYYDKSQYKYLREMNNEMLIRNDRWEYAVLTENNNDNDDDNASAVQAQTALYSFQNISSGMLHCDFISKKSNDKFEFFDRKKLQSTEPIPVTYSEVTEEITYQTGKKQSNIYKFSDYASMPDNETNTPRPSRYSYSFTSNSQRRGLLKEQQIFEDDIKIRTMNFSYAPLIDENNPENRNYIVSNLLAVAGGKRLNVMYYAHTKPTNITTTDHINDGAITSATKLIYDSKNRLSEKITEEIDGRKYFTNYRYADDIIPVLLYSSIVSSNVLNVNYSGFAGGFQQIQRQGWFGRPVEIVSGYDEDGTRYYTGGTISLFKYINESYSPETAVLPTSFRYYLSHPLPFTPKHTAAGLATLSRELVLTLDVPATDYQFMQNNSGNIVFDSRYITTADYEYNNKLRLTKVKPANALETTYVWDENNFYPVSETTGKFTTTYTYKPMVGKMSETDSRGVKTLYEYDEYGRLIKVSREINGTVETLQEYEYNISR